MWHPKRTLRRTLDQVRSFVSVARAIPAWAGYWLDRYLGRPLRRGFRRLGALTAPVVAIRYAFGRWLHRHWGRPLGRGVGTISSAAAAVLASLGRFGRRLTRPFNRGLQRCFGVVGRLAAPVVAVQASFTRWLGRRFRRVFRWLSQTLRPLVTPVLIAWQGVSRWLERRFGKAFRRIAAIFRPIATPFVVGYSALARWVERRTRKLLKINLKKALLVTSIIVVIGSALGYWQGRPIYRKLQQRKYLGLARLFMRRGEDVKAIISARNVLAYNPKNLDAAEILADLADRSQSPQALIWRQRVLELAPTLEHRLALVDCALRNEPPPFPLATRTLDETSAADQRTVAFQALSARLAIQLNQLPTAEAHLEEAIRLDPTNELHRLNLAVLQLRSTNAAVAASARSRLQTLRADQTVGVEALRWLIRDCLARKDLPAARSFSEQLLAEGRGGFADRWAHLSILSEMSNGGLGAALAAAQQQAATNAVQAADLGNWMLAHGRAAAAREWLQHLEEPARSQQPVPLTIATCFQAGKDWAGLQAFLQDARWGERDFIRQALLARALRGQGEAASAAAYWQEAERAASERPEFTALLAQTTRAWGWTNETEQLLATLSTRYAAEPWALQYAFQQYHALGATQALFRVFSSALGTGSTNATVRESAALRAVMNSRFAAEPWALWVMHNLFQYYLSIGNTRGIFEILSTVLNRGSDDVVVQNNLATVSLLLRTNLPMAHVLARQVYEREPRVPEFVATYAYSLHLQGKTAEGLQLLQKLSPADLQRPAVAAYYGCLLAASGQAAKATDYLARADGGSLLPEEKELVVAARQVAAAHKP